MFQRKVQVSDNELLTVSWHKGWSNLSVKLNNIEIGSFTDKETLTQGKWLPFTNGKTVLVRLVKDELEIWDGNNDLMSGLKSGESDHHAGAWKALIAYGIFFLFFGIIALTINGLDIAFASSAAIMGLGLGYMALATWARKTHDKIPLYIAAAINGLFCLAALTTGLLGVAIFGVLEYYLIKGVTAKPLASSETQYFPSSDLLDDGI
jgi:hypothetical protein